MTRTIDTSDLLFRCNPKDETGCLTFVVADTRSTTRAEQQKPTVVVERVRQVTNGFRCADRVNSAITSSDTIIDTSSNPETFGTTQFKTNRSNAPPSLRNVSL